MVEHVVLFKLKPEVTSDQSETFIALMRGMKGLIPEIVDLSAGRSFNPERAKGYDIGLVVRFKDRQGLEIYIPHEHHWPVRNMAKEICSDVLAFDYEF